MDLIDNKKMYNEKYKLELARKYYETTGKIAESFDYLIGWLEYRNTYLFKDYASWLQDLSNNGERWTQFFLQNTVEVGNVGVYNSVSPYLSPIDVVSPYGYTLDMDNSYTGVITTDDNNKVGFKKTELSCTELPPIEQYRTFITQNPDFIQDAMTLKSFIRLAWEAPIIAVSVFGSVDDKDRNEKIEALRRYRKKIISYNNKFFSEELIGKIIGPIVREESTETYNGTYIHTLISDQYQKLLLPEEILGTKLRNLSQDVSCARALALTGRLGR